MRSEYKGFIISWVPRYEAFCIVDYPDVLGEAKTMDEARRMIDEWNIEKGELTSRKSGASKV